MTKLGKKTLTPTQAAAVDHLATGASITDAAAAVKASRQAVSGWLNGDPAFQAALNSRRADLWAETADRLRGLLPRALKRIEGAIDTEGPEGLQAALALIRMAKLDLTPTGGTDPGEIELEQTERESDLNWRRLKARI